MSSKTSISERRHLVPLYGDKQILLYFFHTFWWFLGESKEEFSLRMMLFKILCLLAYPVRIFLRFNHSIKTVGWLITIYFVVVIAAMNSPDESYMLPLFTPFLLIFFWILDVIHLKEILINRLFMVGFIPDFSAYELCGFEFFTEYQSKALFVFGNLFFLLSALHIVRSYLEPGSHKRSINRGTPILYYLFRAIKKNYLVHYNAFIWNTLESILFMGIGAGFLILYQDGNMGGFMIVSGFCYWLTNGIEREWLNHSLH